MLATLTEEPSIPLSHINSLTIILFCAIMVRFSHKSIMRIDTKTLILAFKKSLSALMFGQKYGKLLTGGLFIFIFTFQMLVPQAQTKAFTEELSATILTPFEAFTGQSATSTFPNTFPVSEAAPLWKVRVPMTAYNSLEAQTDSTPCIAASGYDLCEANEENVIAANFLPLGAKVKIPELFGDREFTVVDRMNARYHYRADIWMREYEDAKKFGIKYATVEVYSYR